MDPVIIQNLFSRPKPEKIAIVLDTCIEMENSDCINEPQLFTHKKRYDHLKRAIEIFALSKSQMTENHEYSLLTLDDSAHIVSPFDSSTDHFRDILAQVAPYSYAETCNLNSIFEVLGNELEISQEELPYALHIILIYGRNLQVPIISQINELLAHRDVYFDAVYIHGKDSTPFHEEISKTINSLILDPDRKFSYFFEVKNDASKLYQAFSLLTGHVQQRCNQKMHEELINQQLNGGKKRR
ncbi:unnamed protein product [Blepharisma stoltei]|uniref:BRISC and BRCA1-A complex member 1 n=1 Tax=Blepharisma stoltei TaxID=1481888 RepID=A0AAU9K636_9CILI|nr:unnamed protein product [Blepharisma stoltei]